MLGIVRFRPGIRDCWLPLEGGWWGTECLEEGVAGQSLLLNWVWLNHRDVWPECLEKAAGYPNDDWWRTKWKIKEGGWLLRPQWEDLPSRAAVSYHNGHWSLVNWLTLVWIPGALPCRVVQGIFRQGLQNVSGMGIAGNLTLQVVAVASEPEALF